MKEGWEGEAEGRERRKEGNVEGRAVRDEKRSKGREQRKKRWRVERGEGETGEDEMIKG